jgi:hypothetical protein
VRNVGAFSSSWIDMWSVSLPAQFTVFSTRGAVSTAGHDVIAQFGGPTSFVPCRRLPGREWEIMQEHIGKQNFIREIEAEWHNNRRRSGMQNHQRN